MIGLSIIATMAFIFIMIGFFFLAMEDRKIRQTKYKCLDCGKTSNGKQVIYDYYIIRCPKCHSKNNMEVN